jgi:hypothetical protein
LIAQGRFVPLVFAFLLGVTELSLGVVFAVGIAISLVGFALLAILALFALGLSIAVIKKESISCGCFGASSTTPVGPKELGRNAILLGVTSLGILAPQGSLESVLQGALAFHVYMLGMAGALQAVLIVISLALFRELRMSPHYMSAVPPSGETSLKTAWDGAPWRT